MIYRAGNRFNEENYFLTEIDTIEPNCEVTGFLDGVPVSFFGDISGDRIVGGQVKWNQITKFPDNHRTSRGVNLNLYNNNKLTYNGIPTSGDIPYIDVSKFGDISAFVVGHRYLIEVIESHEEGVWSYLVVNNPYTEIGVGNKSVIYTPTTQTSYLLLRLDIGDVIGESISGESNFNIFDITEFCGETIAEYIYALEQSQPGAGIELFKTLFAPNDYYGYNSGTDMNIVLLKREE